MSARRTAGFATVIAETLADARDELSAEEYAGLLEHSLALLAEVWASATAEAWRRAA